MKKDTCSIANFRRSVIDGFEILAFENAKDISFKKLDRDTHNLKVDVRDIMLELLPRYNSITNHIDLDTVSEESRIQPLGWFETTTGNFQYNSITNNCDLDSVSEESRIEPLGWFEIETGNVQVPEETRIEPPGWFETATGKIQESPRSCSTQSFNSLPRSVNNILRIDPY